MFDEREKLEESIAKTLKEQRISIDLAKLMTDTVKPYYAGNATLWALHTVSVSEKHEILVPVLELMQFTEVSLEDDEQCPIGRDIYFMDRSSKIGLGMEAYGKHVIVKNKGQSATTILFELGTPFEGKPIVPTLTRVAEETLRTVEAFEMIFP